MLVVGAVSRAEEYVTDVAYVRGFEKNLSPSRLRACAALNGFAPPATGEFDYCELGCAHGDTTVALAAAFPRARFVGVDLNAAHIAAATTLALGAQTERARFLERDFEELARDELPDFDYIVAHGVLSWIGPKKRAAVLDFIRRKLKPGGLAYVSYNALPGWAPVEPLRQLILARAAVATGNSLDRARAGLEFADALREAGAHYFESNPAATAMLETMKRHSLHYVVHEHLHAHWVPMYFAQVAAEMAAHDAYFVGQLPLHLNYRDLTIPASLEPIFRGVTDRSAFEGLKDFAVNTFFRCDVFVKGRAGRSDAITREYLETTPFGALGDEGPMAREVPLPNHTLRYKGEVFDALIPALGEGADTVTSLAARTSFAPARVRDAMLHLLLGERISPLEAPTKTPMRIGKLSVPSAYNHWIIQRGFTTEVPVVLAAPAMGNGVELSMTEAAGLYLALEADVVKRAEWTRAFCVDLTHLTLGDRTVTDKHDLETIVGAEAERFRETRVPKLVELGVLASD